MSEFLTHMLLMIGGVVALIVAAAVSFAGAVAIVYGRVAREPGGEA